MRSWIRPIDLRALDLRAVAEPIAILSPVALIVSAQEPVMTLVAFLFVWRSWRIGDFSWARQGWFAALAALWIYALVRTLAGYANATGALMALHWIHFPLFGAALATWILPEERARRRLLIAAAVTMAFFSADSLLQYALGRDVIGRGLYFDRLTSVFGKPGVGIEMAWLFLPATLGLWQLGRKAAAAALGAACVLAVFLSGDRMGLLIVVSEAALMGVFVRSLRKPALIGLPLAAVLLGAALWANPATYHRQIETTATVIRHFDESAYGIVFKSALDIIHDHPVFGVGVHNYQSACLDARYGPLLVGADATPRCQGHPHNSYLLWFAEAGAIGLLLYCAFVGSALWALVRAAAANRDNLVYFALAAALAMRFWPLSAGTSFFASWSAEPLFLALGWALSYRQSPRSS